ncbi:MAG: hypothetical protein ACREQ7_19630 [Candidatus Binatia bacterium]
MKIYRSLLTDLTATETTLWPRIALQGIELALVSTVIEWAMGHWTELSKHRRKVETVLES